MLKNLEARTTIPARDLRRARKWYEDKLGLTPEDETADGLMYNCGDCTGFLLYETQYAGTAQNTVMGWRAENLEREMSDLRSHGVVFEEYDMPGLKTNHGVATIGTNRGAWFKDSEGNILAITEM